MQKNEQTVLSANKRFLSNSTYLYALKATNILVPLITLPYLVRVLGTDLYGVISFSQVFVVFFWVFVDFGFGLSAVQLIAENPDDKEKVSEIFSSVIIIKLVLLVIAFVVFCSVVFSFEKFHQNYLLHLLMFGYVVGEGLFPAWLFQGLQEMKYITFINVFFKVLFLVLIITLINTPDDYIRYPVLYSAGYLIILPFSFILIRNKFDVRLSFVSIEKLIEIFKYSSHFFWSRLALKLYDSGGLFVVGLVFSDSITGSYAIADKIRRAVSALYSPISQALYPYMTKSKNISLYKKVFAFIMVSNVLSLCIGFYFAPELLTFAFGEYTETTLIIWRIFIFVILLDIPSVFLGYPLLGAFGRTHYVNYSLVFTAIVYLILLFALYGLGLITIETVAWLYVATILLEFSIRLFGSIKYKLWRKDEKVF